MVSDDIVGDNNPPHYFGDFPKILPVNEGPIRCQLRKKTLFCIINPHLYDSKTFESAKGSYFDVMRGYFIAGASEKDYEVIDLEAIFLDHYRQYRKRFEYPNDNHWNTLGHEVCFTAITRSALFSRFSSDD